MQIYKLKSSENYISISTAIIIRINDLKYLSILFLESILKYLINLLAKTETKIKTTNACNMNTKPNIKN